MFDNSFLPDYTSFMNLDFYQKMAAQQNEQYSIIIAGAGTGKTYTLLGRIDYLLHQQHLKPEEIVVLSYTKESVRDFEKKAKKVLDLSLPVFTFHKLAMKLLETQEISFSLCNHDDFCYMIHEFLFSYCAQNKHLRKFVLGSFHLFPTFHSFDELMDRGLLKTLEKDFKHMVQLCLAKGILAEQLFEEANKAHGKTKNFFLLISFFFKFYELEKQSQGMFDFDDMITIATQHLGKEQNIPYKHILVDEFQDCSLLRLQFIKELITRYHLSLTVVGDDCQSIYRFSGTENNCFTLLKQFFPDIKTFYLKQTYRNSQELIDIANHFVLKNKTQMSKEIYSAIHISHPVEVLFYNTPRKIFDMLTYIFCQEKTEDILFLGRNSFDWQYYFSKDVIHWIDKKTFTLTYFPSKLFKYLTVHSSKGLEADVVILLHLENSKNGFPSQRKNPKGIKK